VRTIK
jgi:hypothetical protein